MKKLAKFAALLLAVVMLAALSIPTLAADPTDGSITITNAVVGKTYKIYKVFDLTYDDSYTPTKVSYTASTAVYDWLHNDSVAKELFDFELNAAGTAYNVAAKSGKDGQIVNFFSGLVTSSTSGNVVDSNLAALLVDSDTATSTTLTFEDLPYGYYVVESSLGAVVTIDSTLKDVEVVEKNEEKKIDKKIVVDGNETTINNVKKDDIVDFKVTVNAYNYDGTDLVTNYYLYDKMNEALDLYGAAPVVKINGSVVSADKYGLFTKETIDGVTYDFYLNIPWMDASGNFLYPDATTIEVTYQAKVNEKISTQTAMENIAKMDFNSVSPETDPDDIKPQPASEKHTPSGEAPSAETYSYATGIKITKVDGNDTTLTLKDAYFKITGTSKDVYLKVVDKFVEDTSSEAVYYKLTDGTYTTEVPVLADYMRTEGVQEITDSSAGYVLGASTDTDAIEVNSVWYRPVDVAATGDLGASLELFTLIEKNDTEYASTTTKYKKTKVNAIEYATTTTPIEVEDHTDATGTLVFGNLGEGTYTISETKAPNGYNKLANDIIVTITADLDSTGTELVWNYSIDDGSGPVTGTVDADEPVELTVENKSGTELPQTGGTGTVLFVGIGLAVFMVTAIILITKKRLYNEG